MGKKIVVGMILIVVLMMGIRAGIWVWNLEIRGESVPQGEEVKELKEIEEAKNLENTKGEVEEPAKVETEEESVVQTEPEKSEEELLEEKVEEILAEMTLEEKVAQLFVVTPEALTGYETVTAAGEDTREAIQKYPVGGIIYFQKNLKDPEQVRAMLSNTYDYYGEAGYPIPFLSVDEEGGTVTRIGGQSAFGTERFPDMRVIGENGNVEEAKRVGTVIGSYLSELGFNLDFAPVADVLTNPQNEVVKKRSFGADANLVSQMSLAVVEGLESQGVYATLKHYPGHGATLSDSHKGYAYTDKSLEELMESELIPFEEGISKGIQFIMVAHISVPSITGDTVPCSLSSYMITDILRQRLGYNGIVITDALNMGAISQEYTSAEASVQALKAGVDLLLMPSDFPSAYEGILTALESGDLTEAQLNDSIRRILHVKYNQ